MHLRKPILDHICRFRDIHWNITKLMSIMDGVTVTYATKNTSHLYASIFFFITLDIEHVEMFWNVNRCNLYNVGLVIPEKP